MGVVNPVWSSNPFLNATVAEGSSLTSSWASKTSRDSHSLEQEMIVVFELFLRGKPADVAVLVLHLISDLKTRLKQAGGGRGGEG